MHVLAESGIWAVLGFRPIIHMQWVDCHTQHTTHNKSKRKRCWWCNTDTLQRCKRLHSRRQPGAYASNSNPRQIDRQADGQTDGERDKCTDRETEGRDRLQLQLQPWRLLPQMCCLIQWQADNDNVEGVWIFCNVLHIHRRLLRSLLPFLLHSSSFCSNQQLFIEH